MERKKPLPILGSALRQDSFSNREKIGNELDIVREHGAGPENFVTAVKDAPAEAKKKAS